jgi:hypothetical protein
MGDHLNETLQLQNEILQLQNLRVDEESEDEKESEEESEQDEEEESEEEEISDEMLQLEWRRDNEESARHLLNSNILSLKDDTTSWISNHSDCFVNQSQGNECINQVYFFPYSVDGHDYAVWDKVGQAVGNLRSFEWLSIFGENNHEEDDDAVAAPVPIPDWEILKRILRHVLQNVSLVIDVRLRTLEEVQSFARAIGGHPTITGFHDRGMFPYESLDALYSALATLPALESVTFGTPEAEEFTLAHPESLTELLRVPTLRYVKFSEFDFTPALCQATANALIEGTAITNLTFRNCAFSAFECNAMMANGLSRNTSLISITVQCNNARALFDALAASLPSNSTLRHLELELGQQDEDDPDCLSPVFSALGQNTGLKSLKVNDFHSMDESLSTAMKDGLGMNETLESLELDNATLSDDNADSWHRALSFLRTNKALKSLMITFCKDATKSCLSALRSDIACLLQENTSLQSLSIQRRRIKSKAEEYIALVTVLQGNATLSVLSLDHNTGSLQLTDDEDIQIAAILKKNYALESLPNINLKNRASDVDAILRLNGAGRRYLVQDGSSISKGVEVLSRVNNSIDCVFLHLLENPRLCDRSAVEKVSAGESNSRSDC